MRSTISSPFANMKRSVFLHLKSVEGAVVLDEEVLLLADGEIVSELAQQVGEVDSLYCYKYGPMRAQH